jgi:hypothetical protein
MKCLHVQDEEKLIRRDYVANSESELSEFNNMIIMPVCLCRYC